MKRTALKTKTPLSAIGKKQPTCPVCEQKYTRTRVGQPVCSSVKCSMEWIKRKEVAKRVAPYRAKPSKQDTRPSHQRKLTQDAVNAYVRWRDRFQPCCTCGKPPEASDKFLKGSGRDAGHFLPRSVYPSIRYDIRQIFGQCVTCNQHKSGMRHEFRLFMIDKYDLELVEWFEAQSSPVKWDTDEVKEIRRHYRKLLRDEQAAADAA